MASFSTQVQFYAGDISGQTTEIVQWLPDAVKAVVSRIEAANPGLLHMFAAETVLNATDGVSFDTTAKGRILDVQRDSKRCSPVSPQYRAKIGDNTSIYYAPITDPKYYILNGTLTVLPTPTNAAPAQVSSVAYGAISDANGTIASFPSEFYRHVVLWVAMNVIHSKLIDLRVALPTDLDADTTVFNAVADLDLSGIDTLPSSPDAPDYGSIAGFGQAPTYTKPTIGLTGASPDVVIPAFPSITDLDLTTDNALIDINPAVLDAPALSSAPTVADPSGSVPTYTPPKVGGVTEELTVAMDAGVIGTEADTLNFSKWWNTLADMIETEEDIELAQSQMAKITTYVGAYSQAMQNQLNEFNEANVAYQGKLQEYITEAQLEGSHDGNLLNKYAAQIQEYQMQVNNAVQAYQNNELQNKFQKWTTDYTNKLQEYSLAIQQELNEFNKESTVCQATIQKNVTEFAAKDTEYAAGLQEYATEMAEFQALIGKEVTQYTTDLGKKIQLYQAVIQKDTVDYQWLQGQLGYVQAMYEQCWAPYMAGASPDKNTSFVGVQK